MDVPYQAHDRKSGYRFSEKIMRKQKDKARWRLDVKPSRFSGRNLWMPVRRINAAF